MKVRVTSVTAEDVAELFRAATNRLEKKLSASFIGQDFGAGIDQLVIVAVAVDSDTFVNEMFCNKHKLVGRYKDIRTGEIVKFISFALSFNPLQMVAMNDETLFDELVRSLMYQLDNMNMKIPKAFDSVGFRKFFVATLGAIER